MKNCIILIITFLLYGCINEQQPADVLKLSVNVPENNNNDSNTYHVVGGFNDWSFANDDYELQHQSGRLVTELPINAKPLFFTIVKNKDWKQLPATAAGKSVCTYLYNPSDLPNTMNINVKNWQNEPSTEKIKSTLTGNIKYHKNVMMPELGRNTNISVYLPKSYTANTQRNYPVLYMLDGQNIFDALTAYSDEWNIDEILEKLIVDSKLPEIIVVGIDNGPRRWNEYNPWDFINTEGELEKGEGKLTVKFTKNTLKPFIDKTYRTLMSPEHTGFSGSSLGGLMSIYVAIEHSDTFGFVAAFSPSLAVKNLDEQGVLVNALTKLKTSITSKIYVDMGEMEYGSYAEVDELHKLLMEKSKSPNQILMVKDDLGRHCEVDWAKRFPNAISWLMNATID